MNIPKDEIIVVYFDQQMGAPHAVYWSKSFVSALKLVFSSFSVTNEKRNKRDRKAPIFFLFFSVCDGKRRKNLFYRRNT